MGVDLQTYRAKIGTFRHSVGADVITIVCCVNFTGCLKTVGSVVFVGLLLLIAGIEPNPGPKEDELKPSNDDKVHDQSLVMQRQEPHAFEDTKATKLKVTGLPENVDRETLEMIFEDKSRHGGGKVKHISLCPESKTAIVEFEEPEAVDIILGKQPTKILGKEVCVKVYSDTDKETILPVAIKVTGLPDGIDKETLEMIFEDTKRQGGGKVKHITLDPIKKLAIIEFEEPNAVSVVLGKQPTKILGKEVCVETYGDTEKDITGHVAIKVTSLPEGIDKETLEIIFEDTKRQGGGKVKQITLDPIKKLAIIEFEEPNAVTVVLGKQPMNILGKEVHVEAYADGNADAEETIQTSAIKVTGLPDHIDEDTLGAIFENTKKYGGGSVKMIELNRTEKMAIIEFEDSNAAEIVLGKQPIIVVGKEVKIERYCIWDTRKPTRIKLKDLPDKIDEETLKVIFEDTKQQGGGAVNRVFLDIQNRTAVIEFEQSEAAKIVLGKRPIQILEKQVSVEIEGTEDPTVSQPKTIRVTRLPDAMDEETLLSIFENRGGKVVKATLQSPTNSALIEFEEPKAVEIIMSKTPMKIMGHLVELEVSTSDVCLPAPSVDISNKDDTDREEIIQQIIHNLGLDLFSSKKLTLRDVLIIDPYEGAMAMQHTYKELPLLFLKKLLSANSEALDLRMYNLDSKVNNANSQESASSVMAMYETEEDIQAISPLDLLLLTFQCCDPEVKQLLIQKLYLCKLAVPFIYYDFFLNKSLISLWPLRSTTIENKMKTDGREYSIIEHEVVEMPTKFVTFGRYGRPLCSKSRYINGILCDFNADTYFNKDCQSGLTKRYATDGYAEMFWLPTLGEEKSLFSCPMTFINLRGDISCPFLEKHQSFISSLTEVFVIFVDVSSILNSCNNLMNILNKFKVVMVIISSPLDPQDKRIRKSLEDFECNMKNNTNNVIHLLSNHSGRDEKNPKSFCMELTKKIVDCLSTLTTDTLNRRLTSCKTNFHLEIDESEECINCRDKAEQLLKTMTNAGKQEHWMRLITPVQFEHSKKLGDLVKEMHKKKDQEGYHEHIKQKITSEKAKQTEKVTPAVRQFIQCLEELRDKQTSLHYFMVWLKIYLEREKRITAIRLNRDHQSLWNQYKALKRENEPSKSELKSFEKKIQDSESRLEEASFVAANFLREIGHIYDAFLSLSKDPKSIGLPPLKLMSNIIANLFLNGHTFELLDGNSLYMTTKWNRNVLATVHEHISKQKVLALSVLGLQSSGKSTLLNSMFGVQFTASSGRCTRGIHAQMVPLNLKAHCQEFKQFEFVLVIDTEGLRAPELKETNYKRDNELATIITGLGDITLLNVMGENTAEIRDVLQTIVHAFLRLNLSNPKVDFRKSCIFIHQNVSDVSASEKMKTGMQVSIEVLDNVTKESAESEGISHITTFDQVIKFNSENDVWYLPNLWKGNPPMAQINRKYSDRVVEINYELVRRSLNDNSKSFKTFEDIVDHVEDLWQGVLAENFVFSFRNSIEKKAFVALEKEIKDGLRRIETSIDEKLYALCREKFSKCETNEKLNEEKISVKSELQTLIAREQDSVSRRIEEYFDKNDYKDTTIQWKEQTLNQVRLFSTDILGKKQTEVDILQKKRACDILTNSKHGKNEEALRLKSVDLAKRLKGQNLSKTEIESEFEKIWESFVKESFVSVEADDELSLRQYFIQRLDALFRSHPVLYTTLEKENMLEGCVKIKTVSGHFDETGICVDDLSVKLSTLQKWAAKLSVKDYTEKAFTTARHNLEKAFTVVDEKMAKFDQMADEITDRDIGQFLYDTYGIIDNSLKRSDEQFTVKITFHVKALVFVSKVAFSSFEKHNKEYQLKYGIKAKLRKYKLECRERFDAHLKDRKTEETAAILFRYAVTSCIGDSIFQCMSMKVKLFLKQHVDFGKYSLIVRLLTDLADKNSFESFVNYINLPKAFAEQWINAQSEKELFSSIPSAFYNIAKSELNNYISDLRNAVTKSARAFSDMPNIDKWLEFLCKECAYCVFPPESLVSVKQEFGNSSLVDVESFKNNLLEQIVQVESSLDTEFRSVTASTVEWRNYNPYDELFQNIWGCEEECKFCGEPCRYDTRNHATEHKCLQHRPKGVAGTSSVQTNEIWLRTCNYDVATDSKSLCSVFKYSCNSGKSESCSLGKHPFREYKKFYPRWDIEPGEDMEEKSKFWFWFIGKYKDQLSNLYGYNVSNVNPGWQRIKVKDATDSLKSLYI